MLKITELSCEVNEITLQQIELHVQQGDFYIIFGPENAGKTEVLNIIMGNKTVTKNLNKSVQICTGV